MFCNHCGSQLPEGAAFCGHCGNHTGAANHSYEQPVQAEPVRERMDPELSSLANTTMILGIVGLATAINFGIPGIIVSSIALNKAAEFERKAGSLYGKARLGRNLAKPGKIVGIVMTILMAFIILIYGVLYGILLAEYL